VEDFKSIEVPTVCFFDSGIGGLNLLKQSIQRFPQLKYLYFADNYNVPYGSFSHSELLRRVDGIFSSMVQYGPSAAVIACNTVTAHCAKFLRDKFAFPIIGIQPAVKPAVELFGGCHVFATPSTAESESLNELVLRCGGGKTEVVPCPDLASYIENNIFNIDDKILQELLPEIVPQALVLGCTHYIFVKSKIQKRYACPVLDGVNGTINHLAEVLGIFDHFSGNLCCLSGNVKFIGGDEGKNRAVLRYILSQS